MSTAPLSPSPRPSLSSRSPVTSSRTSLDIPSAQSSLRGTPANPRRNRAALRDYYNIKASGAPDAASAPHLDQHQGPLAELDRPGFEAGAYVKALLEREGLEGVLKVENELVGEIRGLDGERKALVYDNYSKLIAATDTIRKMRTNMDPLTPATSTLAPAVSHIAETTARLSTELTAHIPPSKDSVAEQNEKQRQTVRWVLDTPRRLKQALADGNKGEADRDWATVQGLLGKWKAVPGSEEVRKVCEEIMVGDVED